MLTTKYFAVETLSRSTLCGMYLVLKGFALPICMFLASSSINIILRLSGSLYSKAMLHFIKYVQFSEVFNNARRINMLQNFEHVRSQ